MECKITPVCLAVLSTLILALSSVALTCELVYRPDCMSEPSGSLHPHEISCSLFYRCDELGQPRPYSCPPGHYFQGQGTLCAPQEDVTCLQRCPQVDCGSECGCYTTPPPCLTTTPPPCTVTTEQPETTTEQPETTTEQPAQTTEITESTSVSVCAPIPKCSLLESGILKPYPPDCTKYIYCDELGIAEIISCSVGMHFSPLVLVCMAPEEADCPDCIEEITTTSLPPPECPPTPECSDLDHDLMKPYPPDCTKYIYCDELGLAEIIDCSVGMHFSPQVLVCMAPEEANCPDCIEQITTTSPPPPECPPTPECSDLDHGLLKPYPPDCTKYIYCTVDYPELRSCPSGMHFSPVYSQCRPIELAECPECIVQITTTSLPPPECPPNPECGDLDFGLSKPYPQDCSMFIYCLNDGNYEVHDCEPGYHFSPLQNICTVPDLAECPLCIPGTTETPTVTIPFCSSVSCSPEDIGQTKPYPPDCSKYAYCSGDTSYQIRDCEPGLHYSKYRAICTLPEEADCPQCIPISTIPDISTTELTEATTIEITTTTMESTTDLTTIPLPECPPIELCPIEERVIPLPRKKPYPPDCTKYTYCFDRQEPYIGSCQTGLQFSPILFDCLPPQEANCTLCIEP